MVADSAVAIIVILCCITGLLTAAWFATRVALIRVPATGSSHVQQSPKTQLLGGKSGHHGSSDAKESEGDEFHMDIATIQKAVAEGANAFLYQEYEVMAIFMALFAVALFILLGTITGNWHSAVFTTIAFLSGVITSVISGFIGMRIAVFTNARTALSAQRGFEWAFDCAFKGGAVMGFALVIITNKQHDFILNKLLSVHNTNLRINLILYISFETCRVRIISYCKLTCSAIYFFTRVANHAVPSSSYVSINLHY